MRSRVVKCSVLLMHGCILLTIKKKKKKSLSLVHDLDISMSVLLIIILVILVIFMLDLTYKYIWNPLRIQKKFRKQGIKGPSYRILYGTTAEMRQHLESNFEAIGSDYNGDIVKRAMPHYYHWSLKYGKNFLYWFGNKPRLAIADPDLIKEVLLNTSGAFEKSQFNPLAKLLLGDGLPALVGPKWALHRRIINQAFNMHTVKVSLSLSLIPPSSL